MLRTWANARRTRNWRAGTLGAPRARGYVAVSRRYLAKPTPFDEPDSPSARLSAHRGHPLNGVHKARGAGRGACTVRAHAARERFGAFITGAASARTACAARHGCTFYDMDNVIRVLLVQLGGARGALRGAVRTEEPRRGLKKFEGQFPFLGVPLGVLLPTVLVA